MTIGDTSCLMKDSYHKVTNNQSGLCAVRK